MFTKIRAQQMVLALESEASYVDAISIGTHPVVLLEPHSTASLGS